MSLQITLERKKIRQARLREEYEAYLKREEDRFWKSDTLIFIQLMTYPEWIRSTDLTKIK